MPPVLAGHISECTGLLQLQVLLDRPIHAITWSGSGNAVVLTCLFYALTDLQFIYAAV